MDITNNNLLFEKVEIVLDKLESLVNPDLIEEAFVIGNTCFRRWEDRISKNFHILTNINLDEGKVSIGENTDEISIETKLKAGELESIFWSIEPHPLSNYEHEKKRVNFYCIDQEIEAFKGFTTNIDMLDKEILEEMNRTIKIIEVSIKLLTLDLKNKINIETSDIEGLKEGQEIIQKV